MSDEWTSHPEGHIDYRERGGMESPATPIQNTIKAIDEQLHSLGGAIQHLRNRLEPVLEFDNPTETVAMAQKGEMPTSPLHGQLIDLMERTASMVEQLELLRRRLTL